jgi:hypothetical protein
MTTPNNVSPVAAEELKHLENAYIAMLLMPNGLLRIRSQSLLCHLRDALADALGIESEDVQNEYEARASAAIGASVPQWISVDDLLPENKTPVIILLSGKPAIGELRLAKPYLDDVFSVYRYWDNPHDDGQDWEWSDVTHWMPLPSAPSPVKEADKE